MDKVDVDWWVTLRIWWAWTWRTLLGSIVFAFVFGIVIGVAAGALCVQAEDIKVLSGFIVSLRRGPPFEF